MARMEWLAVSLSLLMLACSSSVPVAPAATPAASPEQELVVIDSLLPKIPPTKLQFGAASCFLWNPRLNDGDSFYAVVVQGGGRTRIDKITISDPESRDIFIWTFQTQGEPYEGSFMGVTGWLQVCKDHETPPSSGSPRFATL